MMDQKFIFRITKVDSAAMLPQLGAALEKRTELHSRAKYPKMWELTDKLNSVEKVPEAVQENRRKRRSFLGFMDWTLGICLLIPGLMEPQKMLASLIVGAAAYGAGVVSLWRNKRTLLGVLSLTKGAVLCVGALGNPDELGQLLYLGIAGMVIGLGALLTRKHSKANPFSKAAEQMLRDREALADGTQLQVEFAPTMMTLSNVGMDSDTKSFLYSSFEYIIETDDLLLAIYDGKGTVLQKKDLLTGSLDDFRAFLQEKLQWVRIGV